MLQYMVTYSYNSNFIFMEVMNITELRRIADGMKVGDNRVIYEYKDYTLTIKKSPKVGRELKREYDETKDIKIWLKAPYKKKEFMPSHERVLLDLFIKRIQSEESVEKIHKVVEAVFDNKDLNNFKQELENLNFEKQIDPIFVNLAYLQAYMVEQEINFEGKGNYPDKPRLYIMGYIRQTLFGNYSDMVNIIKRMRINPPADKYTIKWAEKKVEIISKEKNQQTFL